jgi:hypothetical protein
MESINSVADRIRLLQEYYYAVEYYTASHRQLIIVARPFKETRTGSGPKYIIFRTVKYMQMPTFWQGLPFLLGTPKQCLEFLESVGIEVIDAVPSLFYVQLPTSYAYVVCHSIELSDEMPH